MRYLLSLLMTFSLLGTLHAAPAERDNSRAVLQENYEQQGWVLKRTHKRTNTQVYLKKIDESTIKSFLAVTEVKADIPTLIALFYDAESITQWVHRIRSMEVLDENDERAIQYSVTATPAPAKDRDVLLRSTSKWDDKTGVMVFSSVAIVDDTIKPEMRGLVRMTDVQAYWRFIPIDENTTRVEFEGRGDPAGFLPVWLVNMVLHQSPYFTVKRMHRMLKKPKYKELASEHQQYAFKEKYVAVEE